MSLILSTKTGLYHFFDIKHIVPGWERPSEMQGECKEFCTEVFLTKVQLAAVSSLFPFGQKAIIQLGFLFLHKISFVFTWKKSQLQLELFTWQFSPWGAYLVGNPENIPYAMSIPISVNKGKGQLRIIYANCSASCVFWNSEFLQKICAFCINNNSPSSLNFKSLHSLNQDEFSQVKYAF